METSSSARWSATRWSTPSYRPQIRIRCSSRASRAAVSGARRVPAGERRMTRPGPWVAASASAPAKIGSGFITIPPPPPKGGSSVTLCFPSAYCRRSWTSTVRSPASRAFARMLWDSGPGNIPGKSVSTSTRTSPPLRRRRHHPPRRHVDRPEERRHNGEEAFLPFGKPHDQPVVGRSRFHGDHCTQGGTPLVHHRTSHEIRPVELVLRQGGQFVAPHGHDGAGQRTRGLRGLAPPQRENGAPARTVRRNHLVFP